MSRTNQTTSNGKHTCNISMYQHTPQRTQQQVTVKPPDLSRHRVAAGGFTIVEILVVITIIGILAAAVALNVTGYIGQSRRERARMDIASLKNAVELFYLQRYQYPTNEEGLKILTSQSSNHPSGIISELSKDPWGHDYDYRNPGQHGPFDIISYGRDGLPGGEGEDADIGSWKLSESEQ